MKFVVTIRTDNAAFNEDRSAEVARILRDVANQVEKHRYIPPRPGHQWQRHSQIRGGR